MPAERATYIIGPCLGRGGFGEVYRASYRPPSGLARDVVVKVLREDVDPTSQAMQRLKDEGRMLTRLDHPVVLRVFDVVTLRGRLALVAAYVDGQDLADVIAELPTRALVEVVGRVADALDAAWHRPDADGRPMRLVHRDIKPQNIRIAHHGDVTLLDFGIARAEVSGRAAHTQTDFYLGTPGYMAPERFTPGEAGPASDVYALGAVLLEGLAGERLIGTMAAPMMLGLLLDPEAHAARVAALQDRAGVDVDTDVVQLAVDCLRWRAEDRPNAATVATRCEALVDRLGGLRLARWARERTWPPPRALHGALTGQTLPEGDLPLTPAPAPPRRISWPLLGLAAVSAAALVFAASLLVAGLATWFAPEEVPVVAASAPTPASVPEPTSTPSPAPAPAQAAEVATSPLPAPAPFRRRTVEAPQAAPAEPAPPAPAVPSARVDLKGVEAAVLVGGGRRIVLPATDVPLGEYRVDAAFPPSTTLEQTRMVTLEAGAWTIRCGMRNCTLEPGT